MARQFPYNELSHITKKNSWNPEYEQEKKTIALFRPFGMVLWTHSNRILMNLQITLISNKYQIKQ